MTENLESASSRVARVNVCGSAHTVTDGMKLHKTRKNFSPMCRLTPEEARRYSWSIQERWRRKTESWSESRKLQVTPQNRPSVKIPETKAELMQEKESTCPKGKPFTREEGGGERKGM